MLEKPGVFRQGVLGQTAQVPGYKLIPGGPLALSPGGGEAHGERLFLSKTADFLCRTALASHALQA